MKKNVSKKKSGTTKSKAKEEKEARAALLLKRDIAQRAVKESSFLAVHGFLSERQSKTVADRIIKYIIKNEFVLVDRGWKDYLVLLPGERTNKRWLAIYLPVGKNGTPNSR